MEENQTTKKKVNIKTLCECAILLAMSIALSFFSITPGNFGGSITPASMLPILFIGVRHGPKWGFGTAFIYSVFQLLTGLSYFSYIKGVGPYLICILFDFILAFSMLGLSSFAKAKEDENGEKKINVGKVFAFFSLAMILRFICHFISGVTIWQSYDIYNNPWLYSLVYNVVYMLPEIAITLAVAGILLSTKKLRNLLLIA